MGVGDMLRTKIGRRPPSRSKGETIIGPVLKREYKNERSENTDKLKMKWNANKKDVYPPV
jgi:hypothetical protein